MQFRPKLLNLGKFILAKVVLLPICNRDVHSILFYYGLSNNTIIIIIVVLLCMTLYCNSPQHIIFFRFPFFNLFFIYILVKQQLLAAGDQVGTLHVMEVPWNLRHVTTNEVCVNKHILKKTMVETSCFIKNLDIFLDKKNIYIYIY